MELSRKSPRRARGALSSMTNPLILKLCRIEETSADHVTYAGIARKCEFFMLMNVLGIFLALPLDRMGPVFTFEAENIAGISAAGAIGAAISGLIFLLTPLLAFIIKRTIPVTGALYCMSTGFLFTLISGAAPEYRGLVLLAMAITIAIVAAMAALYRRGVRPGKKTRAVIKAFFIASIAAGVMMLICYFIPGLRDAVEFIQGNPLLSIGGGAVYIIVAAIMLLVDFDAIQTAVEKQLPAKYEWIAAFGLAFSVVWLFLKVFKLLND